MTRNNRAKAALYIEQLKTSYPADKQVQQLYNQFKQGS